MFSSHNLTIYKVHLSYLTIFFKAPGIKMSQLFVT